MEIVYCLLLIPISDTKCLSLIALIAYRWSLIAGRLSLVAYRWSLIADCLSLIAIADRYR
ncbi:hypothetical protein [Paenibacillus sacheonensis]|uniref:Uncharacterized protein n=1 Tax=Paenibacillus sacheonensis TaxID=742054 RepID=A0A7X5C3V0_9BACL|nr:hypothetical protein [Paenibacillus sacheonensis]MBM7568935.1 hypothetical protein [Paenibacillus sacheonensis]NBC72690.1 hypothetical protein [Paenibacillus sacheonensis]